MMPVNRIKDCWTVLENNEILFDATPLAAAVEEVKAERKRRRVRLVIVPMLPEHKRGA